MRFRGTSTKTRAQIEAALTKLGARVHNDLTRERDTVTVTVESGNVAKVFEIFADLYNHSTFEENQVEAEKEAVYRDIIELQRDQQATSSEAAYYTSFREHVFGQPVLGVRENIQNITAQHLKDYVSTYQTGSNLVIVASGDVQHQEIADLTAKHFGGLSSGTDVELNNRHKPIFTPSLIFMRDDEMANINTSIHFRAPNYAHEDAFTMWYFKEIMGNYRADEHTGKHLNSPEHQYNDFHRYLGQYPDITIQNTFYHPYSDTGIFGGYMFGNEVFADQLLFSFQNVLSENHHYVRA